MIFYLPNAAILLLKIFTAMANSITPKNLRTASKPAGPSAFSTTRSDFKTILRVRSFLMQEDLMPFLFSLMQALLLTGE